MAPPLSLGLNLSKGKPSTGQKRKKTVFEDDSDDDNAGQQNGEVEISTIGGTEDDQPAERQNPAKKRLSEEPPKRKPLFSTAPPPGKKPGPKPLSKASIFADDDDDDGTTEEQLDSGGMPLGLNASKSKSKSTDDPSKAYTNLSALHSSKKHAQEAEELDPSIYSYDAVYDSLHAKPNKSNSGSGDKPSEGPKYMTSLLRSAEVRKRDQLRARDRMLAREREEEGDEFADKEKFVTSAYKAQQEEMRRIEHEDAEREKAEEERRKKEGNVGMVGFYRDILSRDEQRHEEVQKATEEAAQRIKAGEIPQEENEKQQKDGDKTEAQRAAELNAKGAHIAVNDEGQVVDKRQLLSAGLNVAPKPKPAPSAAAAAATSAQKHDPRTSGPGGRRGESNDPRAGQRARQTEMVAAQLEERARKEAEAEEARQKEIAERNRSRKTESDVSSAKERYLARKREREQAGK